MTIEITRELAPITEPVLTEGDHRKDCCKVPKNLEYYYVENELNVLICRRCGCRHFDVNFKPGQFHMRSADDMLAKFREWEQGRKNACCYGLDNLRYEKDGPLEFFRCQVCGCRHFDVPLDAGAMGIKMT